MIRFNCDYSEGAHPDVLQKLIQTNLEQTPGYGQDDYCLQAAGLIKNLCHKPNADVHFLVGGTQTNLTVIAAALRPYQGVISADTGHINVHETGAIEAVGHKVLALPNQNAKITAEQVQAVCLAHEQDLSAEHCVQPKMVYISHPTEFGTLYTREELVALRRVCDQHNLYLFADGARLGYGLAAEPQVGLPLLAECCDVFYIGGTKIGALFGEAVVITNPKLNHGFRYLIKQKGALLAKGRLLGLQFLALLENGLYTRISKHAVDAALQIRQALAQKGVRFLYDSPTNQQFALLPNEWLEKLEQNYVFSFISKPDATHTAVRICTSWATPPEDVRRLIADIERL